MPWYLKQHIALQKVMQIDGVAPFSGIDACDIKVGPLALAALAGWNEEKMIDMIVRDSWPSDLYFKNYQEKHNSSILLKDLPLPRFFKMRNFDRKWLAIYLAAQKPFPFTAPSVILTAIGADKGMFFKSVPKFLSFASGQIRGIFNPKGFYCKVIDPFSSECNFSS